MKAVVGDPEGIQRNSPAGMGLGKPKTTGTESSKGCEGQQEGLLQAHKQKKEDQGKLVPSAK